MIDVLFFYWTALWISAVAVVAVAAMVRPALLLDLWARLDRRLRK